MQFGPTVNNVSPVVHVITVALGIDVSYGALVSY